MTPSTRFPTRAALSLALAAALALPAAVVAAPLDHDASAASTTTDPAEGTPPASDPRHKEAADKGDRHVKDLDSVVVTASPLRDTAAELSKPTDVLAGERLDENRAASLGETISSIPGV